MNPFELIKNLVQNKIGVNQNVVAESNFNDLGIDHIDVADILVSIEQELGMTFYDKDLMDIETIQDILELIDKDIK